MNMYEYGLDFAADTSAEEVTYRKPNRAARRRADAMQRGIITKKTPFGRVRNAYYDEAADKLVIRHSTRGVARRQITDHLMSQMIAH